MLATLWAGVCKPKEVWQRGFTDYRIVDGSDFESHRKYIDENPVARRHNAGLKPGSSTAASTDDGNTVEARRFSATSAVNEDSRALAPAALRPLGLAT